MFINFIIVDIVGLEIFILKKNIYIRVFYSDVLKMGIEIVVNRYEWD